MEDLRATVGRQTSALIGKLASDDRSLELGMVLKLAVSEVLLVAREADMRRAEAWTREQNVATSRKCHDR